MKEHIERRIALGVIVSTTYLKRCRKLINPQLMEVDFARLITKWCLAYFDRYSKAPKLDLETLFYNELHKKRIDPDLAAEIEEDILPQMNEEYLQQGIEEEPLIEETNKYFREQGLKALQMNIDKSLETGDIGEAEGFIHRYRSGTEAPDVVDLSDKDSLAAIEEAFNQENEQVLLYPGALGKFWNSQMVRGAFVSFMAPEKRGKTLIMYDAAMRGSRQGKNVAVFQAGDMTRNQALRRIGMSMTGCTTRQDKVGKHFEPVKDCVRNQLNLCNKKHIRECDFGIFEDRGWDEKRLKEEININLLKEMMEDEPTYKPCYNCPDWEKHKLGIPYIKEIYIDLLNEKQLTNLMEERFIKKKRNLRISTHSNGTLTVQEIENILDGWEMQDDWKVDILIVDYADILVSANKQEYRHQQNQIWKDLRGLNQKKDCLLITATQADADSYKIDTMGLSNYSEDKRKFSHVTAMYGLNQDKTGREKGMKIMRINKIIMREDEFGMGEYCTVLQNPTISRGIIGSY